MSIKAVLFDLDGTLLPMDQDRFASVYMKGLVTTAVSGGYDPTLMGKSILAGIAAMVKNSGERTNEEAFWEVLVGAFGERIRDDYHMFDEFYRTDFQKIREVCGFEPRAREIIDRVKSRGLRTALATNPLFPSVATESRIRWAGLVPEDFELFTSYEHSHFCKPSPAYYLEVIAELGLSAEECAMVGNDVDEDMIAGELGMEVYLLTDCIINKSGKDISAYPHGDVDGLLAWIDGLK